MQARITQEGRIVCPACHSTQHTTYRREPRDDRVMRCLSRCEGCGDEFTYDLDKEGNPVAA